MTRYSLGLWGRTVRELANAARLAEDAGFDAVWSHEMHRTFEAPLVAAALGTRRVQIGSGIALAFVRSPMITALTALDIDELSDGRFILGLGSGVRRLNENWHGVKFGSPARHLGETVDLIRKIVSTVHTGAPIQFKGEYYDIDVHGLRRPFVPLRERIPIYLAAVGPVMSRLAGEKADGWIGHELHSRQWLRDVILPNIAKGLKQAGRDRGAFTTVLTICCAVNERRDIAIRHAAATVAFYASVRTYREFFAASGFERETRQVTELFRQGKYEQMIDVIPEEMVHAFSVAGTASEVQSHMRAYDGLADVINLSPPHTLISADETRDNVLALIEALPTIAG